MSGIEILEHDIAVVHNDTVNALLIAGIFCLIITLTLLVVNAFKDIYDLGPGCIVLGVLSLIIIVVAFMIAMVACPKVNRYKAIVYDKSVIETEEFKETFDIVESKGNIYYLIDKE